MINASFSDVFSIAQSFPSWKNPGIQIIGIIPIYTGPDHDPLHSKTNQATEIIPVLIPELPLSTTVNQFIDSPQAT